MCGRVIQAVLLSSLLSFFTDSISADCNLTPRSVDNFRQTAFDVAVEGESHVWVATGFGVQLHDSSGLLLDSIAVPGETRVVTLRPDGTAYVGSGSRIYVLRRNGDALSIVGNVDAQAVVNDIVVTSHLFAATANGIRHYNLSDPTAPVLSNAALTTSRPSVSSLALENNLLYAADGDISIELFSLSVPSLPQRTGKIDASSGIAAVHTANGLLYASDNFGRTTEIFAGGTRLAIVPIGSNAFAGSGGELHLVAGTDRTLRAVDFGSLNSISRRAEWQLPATDGSRNGILAVARSASRAFIAAGDLGLTILDTRSMFPPHPLVAYFDGAMNGVRASGDRAWFSSPSGRISERRVSPSGIALAEERNWLAGENTVVRDQRDSRLVTSTGASITVWNTTGQLQFSVTFALPVSAAVLRENDVVALLSNGTLWAASSSTPQQIASSPVRFLTRSGAGIVTGEIVTASGATVVRYYANGDFATTSSQSTIPGIAVGSIAFEGTRAALFTFNGVSVVDLVSGAIRTIPGSNQILPRQLLLSGGDLLLLDRRALLVYDDALAYAHSYALPGDAAAVAANGDIAFIATTEGSVALSWRVVPPVTSSPFASAYYSKFAAAGDSIYLFDANGVDVFEHRANRSPRFRTSLRPGGIIDLAATPDTLVTVSANLTLTSYSPEGARLAERQLVEGLDATVLATHAAGNAVWLSISSGCASGGCNLRTLVIDPVTLATTSTIPAVVDDVSLTGSRAFALTSQPSEMRVFDITDPLHPSSIATRERSAAARSIAAEGSSVYVLSTAVEVYNAATLAPTGTRTVAGSATQQQRLRIQNGCAIITGRTSTMDRYTVPSFAAAGSTELSSRAQTFAFEGNDLFILTDHALEWWSPQAVQAPGRRRAF
jgi:hypothetical protein